MTLDSQEFAELVDSLPLLTPVEMFNRLGELGYVDQERGRRAVCLFAYRHMRRIKRIYVERVPRERLPGKSNMLLVGPTGCGKTHLVELLFGKLLSLPTVIVDITAYSETGYVGQDVPAILTRLLHAAGYILPLACIGIVCLDEFDKIAGGSNRALFAGQGTTKDVSGLGVQRELLKLLGSTEVEVPVSLDHSTYQERLVMPTHDVAFIACGAFSGLKTITWERSGAGMGFARPTARREGVAVRYTEEELQSVTAFQDYGFLPELIGRFSRIVPFEPLSKDALMEILRRNVLPRYVEEFASEGIELVVEEGVLDLLCDRALRRETGARGLESALISHLEEAAFDAFSARGRSRARLFVKDRCIRCELD